MEAIMIFGFVLCLIGIYKIKYGGQTFKGLLVAIIGLALISLEVSSGNTDIPESKPESSKITHEIKQEIKEEVSQEAKDRISEQLSERTETSTQNKNTQTWGEYVGTYNSGMKAYIVPDTLRVSEDRDACKVRIVAVGNSGEVSYLDYSFWLKDNSLHFTNSEGYSGAVTSDMTVENKIWEIAQSKF